MAIKRGPINHIAGPDTAFGIKLPIKAIVYDELNNIYYELTQSADETDTLNTVTKEASGGSSTFIGLNDTPVDYSGEAGKVATVNATEDGLEFSSMGVGDMLKSTYDLSSIGKDLFATSQKVYVNATTGDDIGGNGTINAPYLTIQKAIDETTGSISIEVAPGIYTDDIIFRTGVALNGPNATITGKIICDGVNVFQNMTLARISTITETLIDCITNTCTILFDFCLIQLTTSTDNIQPTLIDSGNGSNLEFTGNNIVYANSSTGINNINTSIIKQTGTGYITATGNTIFSDTTQTGSGGITALDDSGTGIRSINTLQILSNEYTAGYTGELIGVHSSNIGNKVFHNYQVTMTGTGSSTGTSIKTSGGFSQTIRAEGGSTDITGFANNQYTDIGTTDTIDSFFNNVCSMCTNIGAGTLNKVDSVGGDLIVNTSIIDENLLLGTPTNKTLQSLFNIVFTSGYVSGGTITDNLDGTIDVSGGTGIIRNADTPQAPIFSFDWNAKSAPDSDLDLVDGVNNILYVDYNSGSPELFVGQNRDEILNNENNKFELAEIVREGNDLHISDHKQLARSQGQQRTYSIQPVARADNTGLIIGETGTRNITVTAGALWRKYIKQNLNSTDTSDSDTFDSYYTTDSFSTWTKVSDDTQWNNTQYNDITSGLVSISPASKFSFQDFYLNGDGDLVRIYAQAQYNSLAEAEEAPTSSSLPIRLQNNSILIGRVIFQGNDTVAQSILSAFDITFSGAGVTDHGNLSGLADDDHIQYSLLSSQAGTPISTPVRVGNINIDTTNDLVYISTDILSSADWIPITINNAIQTLINKTIDLTDNTITGTKAEFDTACSDDDFFYQSDITIESDPSAVTGADQVINVMSLTTAEYGAIGTPDAATLYIITDA